MTTVLGIDAAWTAKNPSGVAIVQKRTSGWELLAAEPSCGHFLAQPQACQLRPAI